MSTDNVYLCIVNHNVSYKYIKKIISDRKWRYEDKSDYVFRYVSPALSNAAKRAGVNEDARNLNMPEREAVWFAVIHHIYGDDTYYQKYLKEKAEGSIVATNRESVGTTSTTEKEEESMNITVETKHYVAGRDVETMTANDLIKAVKDLEKEIAELKSVNSESKYIEKRIKELQTTLKDVVKHLDSK